MASLFKLLVKEQSENQPVEKPVDKPVDYEKNPRYNQWKKVFEQAGDHVAKENHPKEHADFKQYYEQQTKKE